MRTCACPECDQHLQIKDSELSAPVYCPHCARDVFVLPLGVWSELSSRPTGQPITAAPRGIVLDQIRSEFNVGSMFRTADATDWPRMYLTGITPLPSAKTALGADEWVPWTYNPSVIEVLDQLGALGVRRIALETSSTLIEELVIGDEPTVVVVGNEVCGVSPQALRRVDEVAALPMAGRKASLNVSVALGAALYLLNARLDSPTTSGWKSEKS